MEIFTLIAKGGVIMVPILTCSVISVTIVVERLLFWAKQKGSGNLDKLIEIADSSGLEEMLKAAKGIEHPVARVLAEGASRAKAGAAAHSVSLAMEAQAINEVTGMKRFLSALDTVITLAPLLGLLGTIVGMIQSFDVISLTGLGNPHAVTGGVAEALIATAAGITVAVLTLIPYNYFLAKTERTTSEIERYATRLEMVLKHRQA